MSSASARLGERPADGAAAAARETEAFSVRMAAATMDVRRDPLIALPLLRVPPSERVVRVRLRTCMMGPRWSGGWIGRAPRTGDRSMAAPCDERAKNRWMELCRVLLPLLLLLVCDGGVKYDRIDCCRDEPSGERDFGERRLAADAERGGMAPALRCGVLSGEGPGARCGARGAVFFWSVLARARKRGNRKRVGVANSKHQKK